MKIFVPRRQVKLSRNPKGEGQDSGYTTSRIYSVILWHICSDQEMWRQKERHLLGNSMVTTRESVLSMTLATSSHSNRDTCNNWGTVGSGIFHAVRAEATLGVNFALWVSSSREVAAEASRQSMRLAWDVRQPARKWAWKLRNFNRWKPLPSNVTEDIILW